MMSAEKHTLPPAQQRLLRRRKWTVATVMIVTFLFLLFYNFGSYLFLKRIGRQLENSLDQRLQATAALTAELIERSMSSFADEDDADLLRSSLNRIRLENDLEAAYLIAPDGKILLDARRELERSIGRPYLIEDSTAIRQAFAGAVRVSHLHIVAGNPFKSVYAPVSDIYGYAAVLALEANAGFLSTMGQFYRALYIGVVISLLLLIALAFFLILAMLQFVRTENRLYQSERLASLGQMAAMVAHEIRNPLAIIKSTVDVLREKKLRSEQSDEFFGYINDEILRLNKIVSNFLAFSREPRLEKSRCDLVALLEGIAASFSRQGADLSWRCDQEHLYLHCDPGQIEQMVLNLLINAREAMKPGKKNEIILRLGEERSRGKILVVIEVEDRGVGMLGGGREIFEPFYTTKTSGTGLGLAVCRRIAEAHDGEIAVVAPAEGGTLMRITLPQRTG
jgi:signal transduction histidine kinase